MSTATKLKTKATSKVAKSDKTKRDPNGPITDNQYRWFLDNRYDEDQIPATFEEADKIIDEVISRQRKLRNAPPTDAQLRYLEDHSYNREAMSMRTKGFCSNLIYKIKVQNGELKKTQTQEEDK
jgi:hypothetical protein